MSSEPLGEIPPRSSPSQGILREELTACVRSPPFREKTSLAAWEKRMLTADKFSQMKNDQTALELWWFVALPPLNSSLSVSPNCLLCVHP